MKQTVCAVEKNKHVICSITQPDSIRIGSNTMGGKKMIDEWRMTEQTVRMHKKWKIRIGTANTNSRSNTVQEHKVYLCLCMHGAVDLQDNHAIL